MNVILAQQMMMASGGTATGDPHWSSVAALLHFDGADGSNIFTDEVSGNSWDAHADAAISTAESKFGGASGLFVSGLDYLSMTSKPGFLLGSNDFTLECFIYLKATATNFPGIIGKRTSSTSDANWGWGFNNSNKPFFQWSTTGSDSPFISWNNPISNTTWTHLAVVRNGSTISCYTDGVLDNSGSITGSIHGSTQIVTIARISSGSVIALNAYLDEMRITNGVARYTSNFDPPTAPFVNHA